MSAILKLVQGSEEWHTYRQTMRNASESAAVMGVSPWTTPYQLWLIKTGRFVQETNVAMQRGTDLEPAARAAYEVQTGNVMQPLVLQAGDYSASLDGMNLEGNLILEIKCPLRGTRSDLWQDVKAGNVPEHYLIQVQHQLMVSGASHAHLWIFDGTAGLLHAISRDDIMMAKIRKAWESFQIFLNTDTPPPLTDQDRVLRDDSEWSVAAAAYMEAKRDAEEASDRLDATKNVLVALCKHPKEQGAGVSVTRYWKCGNVDYKKVPELQSVDLDKYRGKSREEVRLTIEK